MRCNRGEGACGSCGKRGAFPKPFVANRAVAVFHSGGRLHNPAARGVSRVRQRVNGPNSSVQCLRELEGVAPLAQDLEGRHARPVGGSFRTEAAALTSLGIPRSPWTRRGPRPSQPRRPLLPGGARAFPGTTADSRERPSVPWGDRLFPGTTVCSLQRSPSLRQPPTPGATVCFLRRPSVPCSDRLHCDNRPPLERRSASWDDRLFPAASACSLERPSVLQRLPFRRVRSRAPDLSANPVLARAGRAIPTLFPAGPAPGTPSPAAWSR